MSEPPATPDELAALYLRSRDVPCPGCGYNRRDDVTATCPECKRPLIVSDTVRLPRKAKLIALGLLATLNGLVGASAALRFVGEGISGSWYFGAWYEWTMLGLALGTLLLHAAALRMLFLRSRDPNVLARRLAMVSGTAMLNAAVTSAALQLIVFDNM